MFKYIKSSYDTPENEFEANFDPYVAESHWDEPYVLYSLIKDRNSDFSSYAVCYFDDTWYMEDWRWANNTPDYVKDSRCIYQKVWDVLEESPEYGGD